MMKQLLLILFTLTSFWVRGQYNNEWIDYGKVYYKFPVAKDGLHRITQSVLQGAGLDNTPVEHFQLWRNGTQIPLYTSVPSGVLDGAGYLEFWGEMNDGKPDTKLYRNINDQLNDKWSLETDTASYFLTVNPSGNNLRLVNEANDIAGNTLAPEAFFMYTYGQYYKNRINPGYAGLVVEYIYSSSYDKGEGYTSGDIRPASPRSETISNLFVYPNGPNASFYIAGAGNALYNRRLQVSINNTQVIDAVMNMFNDTRQQATLPVSLINPGAPVVKITNTSDNPNDRMVIAKYELTYPRQFNFGNSTNFIFELPASDTGNYLRITNFNRGSEAPILYDLSNYKRYIGNITESGVIKFALPPSAKKRKLVLMNALASNRTLVNTLTQRNFIDYRQPDHQGDYLIISNRLLYNGPNGNPVQAYAQYRNSDIGGGYNAKVYDIDQLTDQFAFGIKRHPSAVKNFVQYAESVFQAKPRAVFIIGKGVNYIDARTNQNNPLLESLNLVPPFGHPASDNLLVARDGEIISSIPVGRLSVVRAEEIEIYLQKVKEYEAAGANAPQTAAGRAWMKNIVHAIGGGDAILSAKIGGYMNQLKARIEDTLYGGNVKSFTKSTAVTSDLSSEALKQLFAEGIGIINYFGHSSASTLEFNIDDPFVYENQGKYPFFLVNGCLAGDIFMFDLNRFNVITTLSEKYMLAEQRGSIGFIASSHFGVENYLNSYLVGLYNSLSQKEFGHPVGEIMEEALRHLQNVWGADFFARAHAEEITLHGDPVIHFYTQPKPDYVVEDQLVRIPSIISVADRTFTLNIKFLNIGKAVDDSVTIDVKRQLPDGSIITLLRKRIEGPRYADSIEMVIPVNGAIEKGENKFIIKIDADDEVEEITEANNTLIKSFYILEDEIRPIYPYNFSIVTQSSTGFFAYAPQLGKGSNQYIMEIDTTQLFNSPLKQTVSQNGTGGIIEFHPGISMVNNTVYYWRTTTSGDNAVWNNSSFLFNSNSTPGYNQSHYFQHTYSGYDSITLNPDRRFYFDKKPVDVYAKVGLYPAFSGGQIAISRDDEVIADWMCDFNVLQIVVFDGNTSRPWENFNVSPSEGRFGSRPICHLKPFSFSYLLADPDQRKKAMQLLDSIPDNNMVMIYWAGVSVNTFTPANQSFISDWMADTTLLGSNQSLYHKLKSLGLNKIDSFTRNIPFLFFFKKGDATAPIFQKTGATPDDYLVEYFTLQESMEKGWVESPWFGPALEWNELHWDGSSLDPVPLADRSEVEVFGKKVNGDVERLATVRNARDTTLAFIDSKEYPYLRLRMLTNDTVNATPYQLGYWRINGKLPPEGSIAPNLYLKGRDTLELGEQFVFAIAFKNISEIAFDSVKLSVRITDSKNVQHIIDLPKKKPLVAGDTLIFSYEIDTKAFPGSNSLFVEVNPDEDQPEQYHFNNYAIHNFYVRPDNANPLLDVTFDGIHILNNDIVSAKPHILITLKDENKFLALDDTSLLKVQVKYPDGQLKVFSFTSDTLRFTPASIHSGRVEDNSATIDFNPAFLEDGEYELIVSGRDRSGNKSGQSEYRVSFKIINKPMISNMFNYPNPFTTSTAFVFTLTGSELPQNIRIQVLTITGKIVREITKEELGPLKIGRNITSFKWDGTDQYGQKLANGIYLYRVITSQNGKPLDKYKAEGDQTDQYFNKGYGKMYLMR
ncbi:MAG: C25 family cysteine peptidase [Chitinophagaceae bacterium]|nr:C25 family cysteine peptidase [Chitinophagaceae bacterium]